MLESDLAKPVADWMRARRLTVYAEIPCVCSAIDLVGVNAKNNFIVAVELKRSCSKKVVRQARLNQCYADESWCAVGTRPKRESLQLAQSRGLGVLRVTGNAVEVLIHPRNVGVSGKPLCVPANRAEVVRRCREPSDAAGTPCEAGKGPAQATWDAVVEYRRHRPSADWEEIYRKVPNHYAHPKSMAGAMKRVRELRERRTHPAGL